MLPILITTEENSKYGTTVCCNWIFERTLESLTHYVFNCLYVLPLKVSILITTEHNIRYATAWVNT